jgi:hypothetical protein
VLALVTGERADTIGCGPGAPPGGRVVGVVVVVVLVASATATTAVLQAYAGPVWSTPPSEVAQAVSVAKPGPCTNVV